MTLVETELMLSVPPSKVWQALVAFADYARWHPYIRLSGPAELGARIEYIYTLDLVSRRTLPAAATIIALEPQRVLAWRIRVLPILSIAEGYELLAERSATRLRHWTEYRGLLAILSGRKMAARANAMMREADFALHAHLIRAGKKSRKRQ